MNRVEYHVIETGTKARYENGEPRRALTVTYWLANEDSLRYQPEILWPCTSDNRPELALAMAAALQMAANRALADPPLRLSALGRVEIP